jgi:hypothetical protein
MRSFTRQTKLILFTTSLLLLAVASVEASHHRKGDRFDIVASEQQAAPLTYAQLHHCDWVGPGARAVYRCNLVDPQSSAVVARETTPTRHCDWVGPGARAMYVCRYQ